MLWAACYGYTNDDDYESQDETRMKAYAVQLSDPGEKVPDQIYDWSYFSYKEALNAAIAWGGWKTRTENACV